jgi:hypothetical protein
MNNKQNMLAAAESTFGYSPCLHCKHYERDMKCKVWGKSPTAIFDNEVKCDYFSDAG